MDNGLSLADIKAAVGDNGFDGGWMWVIILFVVLFGAGGFGGFGSNGVTTTELQNGFNFNDLQDQNRDILNAIHQNTYDSIAATKDAAFTNLTGIRDLQMGMNANFAGVNAGISGLASDIASCCCNTARAIDGVNYNAAINTAAINDNTTAQTQKILDALCQNKIDTLQSKINQLEMQNAMCGVIRYPNNTSYTAGFWPFGGCNNGTTF